jgi:uncharacterized protein (TIGR02996 family)
MRTFWFSEGSSNKFWNITLSGKSFTVNFGKVGTAGQTQVKSFADESTAQKEHDKLVAEKLKKGYRETTPAAKKVPTSLRESLEQALVDDPDELANHMAYADFLSEGGDPLGEFIRIQLALEDSTKTANERKKLQQQEKKLLDTHARTWLGELAPFFLDKPKDEDEDYSSKYEYTWRRGWLDTLKVSRPKLAFTRVLSSGPST